MCYNIYKHPPFLTGTSQSLGAMCQFQSTFKELVERPIMEKTDLGSAHNTLEVHNHIVSALDNAGTRTMRKDKQGTNIVSSARPVGVPY
jgi:hypothetical protein